MKKIEKLKLQLFDPIFCQKIEILTKAILFIILGIVSITGCRVYKEIPIETRIEYVQKDSVIIKDSIVFIPQEKVVEIVPQYDTLKLEIEAAKASAWIDSSFHCLRGEIQAKKGQRIEVREIVRTEYRDSIQIKEVPVEVEVPQKYVPKIYKWAMAWSVASIILIIVAFLLKKR